MAWQNRATAAKKGKPLDLSLSEALPIPPPCPIEPPQAESKAPEAPAAPPVPQAAPAPKDPKSQLAAIIRAAMKRNSRESRYGYENRLASALRAGELWFNAWRDANGILSRAARALELSPANVQTLWKRLGLTREILDKLALGRTGLDRNGPTGNEGKE